MAMLLVVAAGRPESVIAGSTRNPGRRLRHRRCWMPDRVRHDSGWGLGPRCLLLRVQRGLRLHVAGRRRAIAARLATVTTRLATVPAITTAVATVTAVATTVTAVLATRRAVAAVATGFALLLFHAFRTVEQGA